MSDKSNNDDNRAVMLSMTGITLPNKELNTDISQLVQSRVDEASFK